MRTVHLWLRGHPGVFDGLAALVVVLLALMFYPGLAINSDLWWEAALPFLFAVPVALRSRYPIGTLYATAALGLIALATFRIPHPAALFAGIVAAYSAAVYAPRRHSWAALALSLLVGLIGGVRWSYVIVQLAGSSYTLEELTLRNQVIALGVSVVVASAPLVIAWLWGGVVRTRHAYLQEALDRAGRLERERDALARLAVVEERARIARDLHDVVAHSLSVVVLQADGARHVLESDPARAARALDVIGRTGREATAEMRRLLGVLRSDTSPGPDRAPQPDLVQLDALVDQVRGSGLPVTLTVTGDLASVPASAALSAYRIVQEALTNTLRHGGPEASAEVSAEVRPDGLSVRVVDDGRGAAAADDGAGLGLRGMRERAAAVGGEVTAGPRAGGGFGVTAWLPYEPVAVAQ
ncbi:sensor histidine kinase [Cryptosporangium aurantiacum]|uniref:histidine kinase n=1 Tax=Cryptosporangium aurantiacum TaxID=134849 RepID=A0A1M7RI92_9ACTN|nr:histidine kinase [Cryptosporangium aurantiacum]SHN45930.1 Signal transduction histidine kinase [Cryptosporangium aurantiacum]